MRACRTAKSPPKWGSPKRPGGKGCSGSIPRASSNAASLTVLVSIEVGDHAGKALAHFAAEVAAKEEVMEFYRLAGEVDYFLRVVVPDAAAFDAFYKRLIETMPLKKVTSRFALENIKSETAFPIDC
jgi:DNA-binding Lrp family transcriptional regulator